MSALFLADLPPPSEGQWWQFCLCLFALLGAIERALAIFSRSRQLREGLHIKAPVEVRKTEEHASKSEMLELRARLEQLAGSQLANSTALMQHFRDLERQLGAAGEKRAETIGAAFNSAFAKLEAAVDADFKLAFHRLNEHAERLAVVETHVKTHA
jgi:hypothetical protein